MPLGDLNKQNNLKFQNTKLSYLMVVIPFIQTSGLGVKGKEEKGRRGQGWERGADRGGS